MIPKKIHYFWVGGAKKPQLAQKCIESWEKNCSDYEIIEWNESNYDFSKNKYMFEAYKTKKWGFVPDYARLDIIYYYGGIYLDTDVEIIKSFDNLLELKSFAGMEKPGIVNLGLGFGSEKSNEIILEMMEMYNNLSFVNIDGSYNTIPSPRINSKVLLKYGLKEKNTIQNIKNMTIFPTDYFCPIAYSTGEINITNNTYSIHHFMGSWLDINDKIILFIRHKVKNKKISKIILFPFRFIRKVKKIGFYETIVYMVHKIKK